MPRLKTDGDTEGAIWGRLLETENTPLSLEAARSLLRLNFTAEDKERMHELAAKAREGSLSRAERKAIENYERVGNLLALMKSKARQRLKEAPASNGAGH